ncbi:MAG: hypothetical protein HY560_09895 [Gemmatimonadetes bacterium]|nr:hypothetical protein [Gemmatimonadota bacterium]
MIRPFLPAALASFLVVSAHAQTSPSDSTASHPEGDRRASEQIRMCEASHARRNDDIADCLVIRYDWDSTTAAVARGRVLAIIARLDRAAAQVAQESKTGRLPDLLRVKRMYAILDSLRVSGPPMAYGFEQTLEQTVDSLTGTLIGPRPQRNNGEKREKY